MRVVRIQVFGRASVAQRGSRTIVLEADLESHEIGNTQDALRDLQAFLDRELKDWSSRVDAEFEAVS